MDEGENQINYTEHKKETKTTNQKCKKKKRIQKKPVDNVSNLWDNFKRSNTHLIGV